MRVSAENGYNLKPRRYTCRSGLSPAVKYTFQRRTHLVIARVHLASFKHLTSVNADIRDEHGLFSNGIGLDSSQLYSPAVRCAATTLEGASNKHVLTRSRIIYIV